MLRGAGDRGRSPRGAARHVEQDGVVKAGAPFLGRRGGVAGVATADGALGRSSFSRTWHEGKIW